MAMMHRKKASLALFGQPWCIPGIHVLTLIARALSTSNVGQSSKILRSPSLVSLDLPEMWVPGPKVPESPSDGTCSNHTTSKEKVARIIDGKLIAAEIRSNIASEISRMKVCTGKVPGLGVVVVGERRDSETYVRNKINACKEVGIKFLMTQLPDYSTEDEVCGALASFNENPSLHGIIVQLPLPQHLNEVKILDALSLEKDVDGIHPLNIGNLAMLGREPLCIPCTPKGCLELLLRCDVPITGKKAVVIGRSNIVGLPMALLLQRFHATVTSVHALTKNPEKVVGEADIVVAAAGVANFVRGSWLKPGAVVIDVGTNPVEDPSSEYGYSLIGDVCYEEAMEVASAVTPVPGGVGPMTVAMLLLNTLESAKRAFNFF